MEILLLIENNLRIQCYSMLCAHTCMSSERCTEEPDTPHLVKIVGYKLVY